MSFRSESDIVQFTVTGPKRMVPFTITKPAKLGQRWFEFLKLEYGAKLGFNSGASVIITNPHKPFMSESERTAQQNDRIIDLFQRLNLTENLYTIEVNYRPIPIKTYKVNRNALLNAISKPSCSVIDTCNDPTTVVRRKHCKNLSVVSKRPKHSPDCVLSQEGAPAVAKVKNAKVQPDPRKMSRDDVRKLDMDITENFEKLVEWIECGTSDNNEVDTGGSRVPLNHRPELFKADLVRKKLRD